MNYVVTLPPLGLGSAAANTRSNNYNNIKTLHYVLQNDTDIAHYNLDADQPIFDNFWHIIATEFELS